MKLPKLLQDAIDEAERAEEPELETKPERESHHWPGEVDTHVMKGKRPRDAKLVHSTEDYQGMGKTNHEERRAEVRRSNCRPTGGDV